MNRLLAFDPLTGERLFDQRVKGQDLLVTATDIYVCGTGSLERFSYPQGAPIFHVELPSFCGRSMLEVDGALVVQGEGEICCVSMTDGAVLWHDKLEGFGRGAIALATPGRSRVLDRG